MIAKPAAKPIANPAIEKTIAEAYLSNNLPEIFDPLIQEVSDEYIFMAFSAGLYLKRLKNRIADERKQISIRFDLNF